MDNGTISRNMINKFEQKVRADVDAGPGRKNIHVSDLTHACLRKSYYKFQTNVLPNPKTQRSYNNLWLGNVIHEHTNLGGLNEFKMRANIRTMSKIEEKDITPENFFDCITGTADDIFEIEGEIIIADKKTWANYTRAPKKPWPDDAHIIQLQIYKLLYYITTGKEAKKGSLIYLDKVNTLNDPTCFTFDLPELVEIKDMVLGKLDELKVDFAPNRVVNRICNYCDYNKTCKPPGEIPKWFEGDFHTVEIKKHSIMCELCSRVIGSFDKPPTGDELKAISHTCRAKTTRRKKK